MLKQPGTVLAGSSPKVISPARRGSLRSRASRFSTLIAVVMLFTSIVPKDASAAPITYTQVFGSFGVCLGSGAPICAVGPSGSLGGIAFSNAIVTLTFQGDTANVVPFSVFSVPVTDPTKGVVLAQGTFLPSAGIYVGVDNTNNGVSSAPRRSPSAIPRSRARQSIQAACSRIRIRTVSAMDMEPREQIPASVPVWRTYDLKSNFTSGLMFEDSCFNFPTSCDAPPPLATTGGDFFITPFVPTGLELGIVGTSGTEPRIARSF